MWYISHRIPAPLFFQTLLEAKEEENVESFTEAVSTLSLKGKSLYEKNR